MSKTIDQDETYTYEILQEDDSAECADLLAHSFVKSNPYELYMKTTYGEFYTDAFSLCKSVASANLSVIARHKQTNEIHGIVQAVDVKAFQSASHSSDTADDSEKRFDPIMEILSELERRYLEDYEKKYGELQLNSVAHIFMAGIRLDCHGKGLGTKLHQVLFEHLRRQGIKHVIVDPTNPSIYHIYTKKLNGKEFTSIYAPTWISKNKNGDEYHSMEHFDAHVPLIEFDL